MKRKTLLLAAQLQMAFFYRINIILIVCLCAHTISAWAQKNITNQSVVWYGYTLTLQLSDRWYWQNEIQERHYINPTAQHQFLVRSHLHRLLGNSGWEASAGICAFWQSPNDPNATNRLKIPELRPHIEFIYKQKLARFALDHRYRAEARFFHATNDNQTALEDGFAWGNYRFRYRLQATLPLWKLGERQSIRAKLSDEIMMNVGGNIVKNVFDQNRIYAGFSIDVLPNLMLDIGYLNWYQQRPSGDFYQRHILTCVAQHKLNLEKRSKTDK